MRLPGCHLKPRIRQLECDTLTSTLWCALRVFPRFSPPHLSLSLSYSLCSSPPPPLFSTVSAELRALCSLLGPFGVKQLNADLVSRLGHLLRDMKAIATANPRVGDLTKCLHSAADATDILRSLKGSVKHHTQMQTQTQTQTRARAEGEGGRRGRRGRGT